MGDVIADRSLDEGPTAGWTIGEVAIATVLIGLVAVTSESLWIDEFASLVVANHASFTEFRASLADTMQSEAQMPFYLSWLWMWMRVFGSGEWSLRAANIPWLALGTGTLAYWAMRGRLVGAWPVALVAAVYPPLWFYANEARPYIMQYAGGAMFLGGVMALLARSSARKEQVLSTTEATVLAVGSLLLTGSSALGMLWLLTGLGALGWLAARGRLRVPRGGVLLFAAAGAIHAWLGVYYAETIRRGARAATIDGSILSSVGSMVYEPLGLLGLGPARLELREAGPATLTPWLWAVIPAALVIGVVLLAGCSRREARSGTGRAPAVLAVAVTILPVLFLAILGQIISFRVLARHLTPILPIVVLLAAIALSSIWRRGSWRKGLAVAFVAIWATSSLSLRFDDRHHKDQYRAAAASARRGLERGMQVWWVAMREGAEYYGLRQPADPLSGADLVAPINLDAFDAALRPPDLVILSKPDLYDRNHVVSRYADEQLTLACEFPAFRIYLRSADERAWICGP